MTNQLIEEKIKEFDDKFEQRVRRPFNEEPFFALLECETVEDLRKEFKDFLKTSLLEVQQEERKVWEEKIDKVIPDIGILAASSISELANWFINGFNQAKEEIKKIIKDR